MSDTIYPKTAFDKYYGHKPARWKVPLVRNEPTTYEPVDNADRLKFVTQEKDNGYHSWYRDTNAVQIYDVWFYFKDKWQHITKNDILNPNNLRMRREFNECLTALKKKLNAQPMETP